MLAQVIGGGAGANDDVYALGAFQLPHPLQQAGERGLDDVDLRAAVVVGNRLLDDARQPAGPLRLAKVGDQRDHPRQVMFDRHGWLHGPQTAALNSWGRHSRVIAR
ncbi:hypothetical protein D9M71_545450 [compost metagenome]